MSVFETLPWTARALDMQGNTWHFCRWAKWPTCWKRHFLIHFWDTNGTDVAGDHIIKMAWCSTGNKPLPEPTTTQIYWRIYASPCHDVFMYRARISYNLHVAGVADSAFNRILWKVCLSFDSPGSYLPLYSLNGNHDDVIKWKHFPCYWPFVPGIHRWSVNSPHKGQWHGALVFSLTCVLNKRLNKQYWGWWFETPSRSLWRHCNSEIWQTSRQRCCRCASQISKWCDYVNVHPILRLRDLVLDITIKRLSTWRSRRWILSSSNIT